MVQDDALESKDGFVTVKILKNGLEAAIDVSPAVGEGKEPIISMAYDALKKAGVVYGIDSDILQGVFNDFLFNQEVVVAYGKPAVDGKDAEIKYYVDLKVDLLPKEDNKGNVDYKDIKLIQSATKGQKLAEVIPPVPGEEGKTVTGSRILPRAGKNQQLPRGLNTETSKDNPNVLISSFDGNVRILKGTTIQIDEIFVVENDVDFGTGNLNFIGSMLIKGDVKSGFEVKTKNDLEINGLVEDAKIYADGNVIIKNGFLGRGNGIIEAGGNVILKYCENQTIKAKGYIIVGEAVLHSNLKSESKIEVKGTKGVIVGGTTIATKGVIVKELGNYQEIKTEVTVGIDEDIMKKIEAVEEEIKKNEENIDNVKKALYTLYKKKMSGKGLEKDEAELLTKLQKFQSQLPNLRQQLEEKKLNVEKELKKYDSITIDVLSKVYPGTKIAIQNCRKSISKETSRVRFKVVEKEIKELSV